MTPARTTPLVWYRVESVAGLLDALGPHRPAISGVSRGRVVFDGFEAWKAGPSWVVGDPADLRRLFDAAAVDVLFNLPR